MLDLLSGMIQFCLTKNHYNITGYETEFIFYGKCAIMWPLANVSTVIYQDPHC